MLVHQHSAAILCTGHLREQRIGYGSGRPYQSACGHWNGAAEKDLVLRHARDPGVKEGLHATQREHFLRVSPETFSELRQNNGAGMHQHHPQHLFPQIRVKSQSLADEVIECCDGFHTGEPAARNHERQQCLPVRENAFGIGLFQMADNLGAQPNGVREGFHRQRELRQAWLVEKVRDRSQREHQMIVGELVRVVSVPM